MENKSNADKIKELFELHNAGAITKQEYELLKSKVFDSIQTDTSHKVENTSKQKEGNIALKTEVPSSSKTEPKQEQDNLSADNGDFKQIDNAPRQVNNNTLDFEIIEDNKYERYFSSKFRPELFEMLNDYNKRGNKMNEEKYKALILHLQKRKLSEEQRKMLSKHLPENEQITGPVEYEKSKSEKKFDTTEAKRLQIKKTVAIILGSALLIWFIYNRSNPLQVVSIEQIAIGKIISFCIYLVFRIISTILCVNIAEYLNRSQFGWGVFGFILPPISLIAIFFMDEKKLPEDVSKLDDQSKKYVEVPDDEGHGIYTGKIQEEELKGSVRTYKTKTGAIKIFMKSKDRPHKGDVVYLDDSLANNGKFKIGWRYYIVVENGRIKRFDNE